MASELRPETLRKKYLSVESLPAFLVRMTLLWQERQDRLAVAAERASAASVRSQAKAKAVDPERYRRRRADASRRYAERHPERVREKERRRSLVLAAQRTSARGAKRANRTEGYPKALAKSSARELSTSHLTMLASQDDLSRVWFAPAEAVAARHENKGSPAL